MIERHAWLLFAKNARAYFSKRNDLQTHDHYWITGDVHHCVFCGDMEIRPYAAGHATVAVVLADELEEKFALLSLEAENDLNRLPALVQRLAV